MWHRNCMHTSTVCILEGWSLLHIISHTYIHVHTHTCTYTHTHTHTRNTHTTHNTHTHTHTLTHTHTHTTHTHTHTHTHTLLGCLHGKLAGVDIICAVQSSTNCLGPLAPQPGCHLLHGPCGRVDCGWHHGQVQLYALRERSSA